MFRIISICLFLACQSAFAATASSTPTINYLTGIWSGTSKTKTAISDLFTTKPFSAPIRCEFPAITDSLTSGTLHCVTITNSYDGSYFLSGKSKKQLHWSINGFNSFISNILEKELTIYANLHKSVGIDTSTIEIHFRSNSATPINITISKKGQAKLSSSTLVAKGTVSALVKGRKKSRSFSYTMVINLPKQTPGTLNINQVENSATLL